MAEQMYKEEHEQMQKLTESYVKELTKIWRRTFDDMTCKEYLTKLTEHAKTFYEDLLAESLEKETFVRKEIDDLYEEAEDLGRLLKVDVQFPGFNNDVPLLVLQSEMDRSLAVLRDCLRQRREEIRELLLEQDSLCDDLGVPPCPLLLDPLPSADEIADFRKHLETLKELRVDRINDLSHLRREIKNYLQILELNVNTETEDRLLNHRQIKLSKETFTGLQRMREGYKAQVREVQEMIDNMRRKLEKLWERLKVSPGKRQKFQRYTDYNQHTYDILNEELQRCEMLKQQNIKLFVEQIRKEIAEYWDKTLRSQVELNRFSYYRSHCYTDDLLMLHEMELEDLKSYYESNKEIFDLYGARNILWERMTALEAKASDPARYTNRGGQLLKEEKERKTIATKLPKIEQQITDLVRDYEEREHVPFFVYGENILELIAKEWENKRKEKGKICSARKNAQTPLSKSHMIASRTPMSQRNLTAYLRKAQSKDNLFTVPTPSSSALKRKLNVEKEVPAAKRSLIFAKTSAYVSSTIGTKHTMSSKKPRVIGSTIARRRSGRISGAAANKHRLSGKVKKLVTVTASGTTELPKIVLTDASAVDDTYMSFEKCIEPESRSSMIQLNSTVSERSSNSSRAQRLQRKLIAAKENVRSRKVPTSPHKFPTQSLHHVANSPGCSSAVSNFSRKLTTKNLPIII